MLKPTLCYVLISLFFGCAVFKTAPKKKIKSEVEITSSLALKVNHFRSLLPRDTVIVQLVEFKGLDRVEQLQVIFKNDKTLIISGMSTMGFELFNVNFLANDEIEYDSSIPEDQFLSFFEKVMADMLMVNLSVDDLLERFVGDVKIVDDKGNRNIFNRDGRIISIQYDHSRTWTSDIKLINYYSGYKLGVKNLKYELLHK